MEYGAEHSIYFKATGSDADGKKRQKEISRAV